MAFLLHSDPDPAALQGLILSAAQAACQAPRIAPMAPPRLIDFRGKSKR